MMISKGLTMIVAGMAGMAMSVVGLSVSIKKHAIRKKQGFGMKNLEKRQADTVLQSQPVGMETCPMQYFENSNTENGLKKSTELLAENENNSTELLDDDKDMETELLRD